MDFKELVQRRRIESLHKLLASHEACIQDTLTLLSGYDGYETVTGLKKLIDDAQELLASREGFLLTEEDDKETI